MKKLLLILSLAGAVSIQSMELQEKPDYMGMLPSEVKVCIISALNGIGEIKDIAYAIQATSHVNKELNKIVNQMYGKQEDLKALLQKLSDKSGFSTADIFNQFQTIAKRYRDLDEALASWCAVTSAWVEGYNDDMSFTAEQVAQRIACGANVNFGRGIPLKVTLTHGWNPKVAELLLNAGANPKFALDTAIMETKCYTTGERGKRLQCIRQLIEHALKK